MLESPYGDPDPTACGVTGRLQQKHVELHPFRSYDRHGVGSVRLNLHLMGLSGHRVGEQIGPRKCSKIKSLQRSMSVDSRDQSPGRTKALMERVE